MSMKFPFIEVGHNYKKALDVTEGMFCCPRFWQIFGLIDKYIENYVFFHVLLVNVTKNISNLVKMVCRLFVTSCSGLFYEG